MSASWSISIVLISIFPNGNALYWEREIRNGGVYFDARAKIHLQHYLAARKDTNPALFVGLNSPWRRLSIAGVERFLAKLGSISHVEHVHPHKFRRTMATMAIGKGMPIEQLQKLLGHTKIDTTLHYAIVNETNIKLSHQRYIC